MDNGVLIDTPQWVPYVRMRLDQMHERVYVDGEAPYPTAADTARAWELANELFDTGTRTPSVVPGDDGGVEFVWHLGGWDVVLTVDEDAAEVWARDRATNDMFTGALDEARGWFVVLLDKLTAGSRPTEVDLPIRT